MTRVVYSGCTWSARAFRDGTDSTTIDVKLELDNSPPSLVGSVLKGDFKDCHNAQCLYPKLISPEYPIKAVMANSSHDWVVGKATNYFGWWINPSTVSDTGSVKLVTFNTNNDSYLELKKLLPKRTIRVYGLNVGGEKVYSTEELHSTPAVVVYNNDKKQLTEKERMTKFFFG